MLKIQPKCKASHTLHPNPSNLGIIFKHIHLMESNVLSKVPISEAVNWLWNGIFLGFCQKAMGTCLQIYGRPKLYLDCSNV